MGKPSDRKRQKKKKRERRLRERKVELQQRALERRRSDQYPELRVVVEGDADPDWVALVRRTLDRLDFNDSRYFSAAERSFLKLQRKAGFDRAYEREMENYPDVSRQDMLFACTIMLGHRLFDMMGEKRMRYIPYADLSVTPVVRHYHIEIRSLKMKKSRAGRIYYSNHRPTVRIDGVDYQVGWKRHAIERVCERVAPDWKLYGGLAAAFAFFEQCLYFEPITLPSGQPALTFYNQVGEPGFAHHRYAMGLAGPELGDTENLYYRVGYCPIVLEDGYAAAKTFLCPGFRDTPEYEALAASSLPKAEKHKLMRIAREASFADTVLENNFDALKWFHNHAVVQVRRFEDELFAPMINFDKVNFRQF